MTKQDLIQEALQKIKEVSGKETVETILDDLFDRAYNRGYDDGHRDGYLFGGGKVIS